MTTCTTHGLARFFGKPKIDEIGQLLRPTNDRTKASRPEQIVADAGALQWVSVHVPDRPGVFAGITQALGAERINIEDFDLEHISPERGGTVTLLVTGEDEALRAASLLETQGYTVVVDSVIDEG